MTPGLARMVCACCLAAVLAACDGRLPARPTSGGQPYSVLIVTADDTTRRILKEALTQSVEGLPANENAFDVSVAKAGTLNEATRYARCVITVSTAAADGGATPAIRYGRDVYARPQLVVSVSTPDARRLAAKAKGLHTALARLINRFEAECAIGQLRRRRNTEAEKAAKDATGASMLIPAELTYSRRGKDFIWLTDNAAGGARSVCVYTYPGTDTRPARVIAMRDSIMKANLPGAAPGAHMATETGAAIYHTTLTDSGGRWRTEVRGLWRMEGGAMGGPFVCHAAADSARGRTVVAEGFVFAPGKRKRNMMRQLEAALTTLRLNRQ